MEPLEPTTIRLPRELRAQLEQVAASSGRSMDDLIRDVLQHAVKHQPLQAPVAKPADLPSELIEIIDQMYPGSGWNGPD